MLDDQDGRKFVTLAAFSLAGSGESKETRLSSRLMLRKQVELSAIKAR